MFKLSKWADIIYIQGSVSEGLPACLAAKLRGRKYILKIVGDYAWEQGRQRFGVKELLDEFQQKKYSWQVELMRKIERLVARGAETIITPSQYLKNIVNQWGIEPGKIKVIYNAAPEIKLNYSREEARQELNLAGDIILSAGRLTIWKGFSLLIDLMPELLKKNDNFKLYIIGDGPDREKLKVKIKELKLENNVFLIGNLEQARLWQYMRASDMFVLNTGYEGLPHIIIEARQIGLPIITTHIGGNKEIIEHERTGLLVGYNEKEEIKQAILRLWQDKGKSKELAVNSQRGLENFQREKMIAALVNIFKKIV